MASRSLLDQLGPTALRGLVFAHLPHFNEDCKWTADSGITSQDHTYRRQDVPLVNNFFQAAQLVFGYTVTSVHVYGIN